MVTEEVPAHDGDKRIVKAREQPQPLVVESVVVARGSETQVDVVREQREVADVTTNDQTERHVRESASHIGRAACSLGRIDGRDRRQTSGVHTARRCYRRTCVPKTSADSSRTGSGRSGSGERGDPDRTRVAERSRGCGEARGGGGHVVDDEHRARHRRSSSDDGATPARLSQPTRSAQGPRRVSNRRLGRPRRRATCRASSWAWSNPRSRRRSCVVGTQVTTDGSGGTSSVTIASASHAVTA